MDKHKGLGHVMDVVTDEHINVRTAKRRVWRITNSPGAYIDLYLVKPETWKSSSVYLECQSLGKETTNNDLLFIGYNNEDYVAKIFPFTIISSYPEGIRGGITPAHLHVIQYCRAKKFGVNIFLPFLAFGQLTIENKTTNVLSSKNNLDFMQARNTNEIIVFDLKSRILTLNSYLKSISANASSDLKLWSMAFQYMYVQHGKGFKIGHSSAKNIVIGINDKKIQTIQWIDATGFDTFYSIKAQRANPQDTLVTNFKKLLDINRLLIDNSYVEHIANTLINDEIYYTIYKFTQQNFPELANVIFFSKKFVALKDATSTEDSTTLYTSKTSATSTDDDMRKHITVIYSTPEVRNRTDVPEFENFVANIKRINVQKATEYLMVNLDKYMTSLRSHFLEHRLQNMSTENFQDWTFAGQHLEILFSDKQFIGPIFINTADKKLYYKNYENRITPISSEYDFCLETTSHYVTDEQGNLISFIYIPEDKKLFFIYGNREMFVDTDKLNSMKEFKLSPKNEARHHVVNIDDQSQTSMQGSSQILPPSLPITSPRNQVQPPIILTQGQPPIILSPTSAEIIPRLVQKNVFHQITISDNKLLACEFNIHDQKIPCPIYYKVTQENSLEYYYCLDNHFYPFQPAPMMPFWSYDPTPNAFVLKPGLSFRFWQHYVFFYRNNIDDGRYDLLSTPLTIERPVQLGPHI